MWARELWPASGPGLANALALIQPLPQDIDAEENFASSHARIVIAKTGTHFLQNTRGHQLDEQALASRRHRRGNFPAVTRRNGELNATRRVNSSLLPVIAMTASNPCFVGCIFRSYFEPAILPLS
jgi:hypothetical protein